MRAAISNVAGHLTGCLPCAIARMAFAVNAPPNGGRQKPRAVMRFRSPGHSSIRSFREEERMPRYLSLRNVVTFASMTALPLALCMAVAKARGVGVAHQTSTQTTAVGRAMNPSQLKSLIYDARVDNCKVLNCGAVFINGQSQRNNFGDSIPYTTELYADANECLRLEVTHQTTKVPLQLRTCILCLSRL
jgi:hypothetical protein